MMKDIATALNALVEPAGLVFLFINGDRECLPSTVVNCIDDSHVEFLRTLSKMVCARHSYMIRFSPKVREQYSYQLHLLLR